MTSDYRACKGCSGVGVVRLADEYRDCPHCGGTGEARGSAAPRELRPHELSDCVAAMRQLRDVLEIVAAKLTRVAAAMGGPSC